MREIHAKLINEFPPPEFDALRKELASISRLGVTVGLSSIAVIIAAAFGLEKLTRGNTVNETAGRLQVSTAVVWLVLAGLCAGGVWLIILAVRGWIEKKVNGVFQDQVWDAQRQNMNKQADKHQEETTKWLNSLIGAVWPLINPDLFASLADTLEDVMQASIPSFIRMVSVDDIGQGSEALRILGVRWLPTGAAAKSVTEDGGLTNEDRGTNNNSSGNSNGNGNDNGSEAKSQKTESGKEIADGLQAEEGDFVNLEVAFAYRTRTTSKSLKERTKDMHLYLAFYLPGNIKVPVWVDLQGIVGLMRLRLQLTPDPPFFALCTLTFLGQPKVNLSCVPLSKHALNIMDVPFISNFVQSSVDAAMAEYVAPKSLMLDLKDMLAGDDFKKDTDAKGVLMINIKRGYDFKMGDTSIPLVSDGSSDPYVSVGWAKFSKVLWSTRILISEMEPHWDETFFVLVTPQELNVDERIRIQLWDSDRMSADDDLGRIEVGLKELMTSDESNGQMWEREDGFRALKSGDNMPGKLVWSVGYYSKTRIQQCQFDQQTHDPEVKSMKQLEEKVQKSSERKLRESMIKDGKAQKDGELQQQKHQELEQEQSAMIISAPPPDGYPSGLFSIQIHNITGLQVESLSKTDKEQEPDTSEGDASGEGLPSAYCMLLVNHKKVFKTRTKPQNSKPFYNAGCERFIRDWTECEVYVAVRDSRVDEDDPLLGMVHLPLYELFKERSQVMGYWPIAGGIGHGRIRLSMVWRSVQLQAPSNLLGWDFGTVDIEPKISSSDCPEDLKSAKLKFKTNISKGKMYSDSDNQSWTAKKERNLNLAVQRRYSSCMSIAFKTTGGLMGDKVPAFCVLWLKNLSDEEPQEIELPIWKGDFKRATACCLDDCGEKVGTLKLKITFWAGMGSAHSTWANKNQDVRDIVEIIDTARDNDDTEKLEKKAGIVDDQVSSDSDTSDEDEDEKDAEAGKGEKQGPIDQIRDYKKRDKGLHRQHRGIMQWKIPRTAKWVKNKAGRAEDKVEGIFSRHTGGGEIETEV